VTDEYETEVNDDMQRKAEKAQKKPAPVPLCPPSVLNQELNLRLHGE
jgi:hypothetical protein